MTQYEGFLLSDRNIFRKLLCTTTFSLFFFYGDCFISPPIYICFSHSPSRSRMSKVLPGHVWVPVRDSWILCNRSGCET